MNKKTVVLDTSIMKYGDLLIILKDNFSKVIFTIPTIREMDCCKKYSGSVGYNIRNLLAECANDKKSIRYEVIAIEEENSYADDNIINFLRKNTQSYCLLTADNAMACKCKAYNIEYYFPWEFLINDEEMPEDLETNLKQKEGKETQQNFITLRNCFLSGGELYMDIPKNTKNIKIMIFDAEGNQKLDNYDGVKLEISDVVFIMTYKKDKQYLAIAQYEVCETASSSNNAIFIGVSGVKSEEEIEKLNCYKEVKEEAKIYLSEVNQ